MPRPVFPVVRLPYDRPDRVARVLDAVRREFSRRQPAVAIASTAAAAAASTASVSAEAATAGPGRELRPRRCTMTAPRVLQAARESENGQPATTDAAAVACAADPTVDHITVGVRDCTLTPKPRPEIMVTATAARNAYLDKLQQRPAPATGADDGGPAYLLVPPVNITAEISRPPLQTPQYTATS